MTFKVGDRVVFGFGKRLDLPVWNFSIFEARDSDPIVLVEGVVDEVHKNGEFSTKYVMDGKPRQWNWPAAPSTYAAHAERVKLWWPRLAGTDSKIVPAAPEPTPVWQEAVSLGRRNDLPDPVLAQMIDRGERGVRRTLRFWPENRRLVHRQERVKGDIEDSIIIRWFWEVVEKE